MAFGVIHFFPGGTQEQYDATLAAVHPGGGLPKGQIYHAAGASDGGWSIIAIHDTKESWETFHRDFLFPRLKEGVKGGFASRPEEKTFEVYNLQTQKASRSPEASP